ncbi:MAG TPA: SH3 domain-containing protein [Anaerolineales bacterium]|nr:SH3 domain-containing protein [Anaerolineales bacterium]
MYKLKILSLVLLLIALAGCAPILATPSPAPAATQPAPAASVAVVQSVEVQILEAEPLQANAIIRGQLPDGGCTTISSVDQVRNGNTFNITLMTTTDPLAICTLAATPFEKIVPLEVSSLPPATYTVNANGVEATFELLPSNTSTFQQVLVDALNRRDYELQKIMMDDLFTIGYWLSEGTENTPEEAVDQLQKNLLNSTSPITADYNKNLSDLLGTDPGAILGPDIGEASPIFVTGLGAEGKDEGILLVAKQPDGGLYWHGLLFAKNGFAQPAPEPIATVPVDMNAYQTNVKYVMALQDVNIRSGPGMQFRILSYIAEGQTAKVTGVNANGNWWRVICPDNSTGSCWVSALSSLTTPSDGPLPDTSVYPTDVQYVMAQQDLTIYSGPSNQFSSVGYIAAGQTARVTGVNADRSWWRVICPDNSMGSCWVSADRKFTKPADPVTKADVQSVEIQVLESFPVQVNAIARGQLPDAGCTTIAGVNQSRSGNTFNVTLTTTTNPNAMCSQVITPFEYVIPLDVSSLLPAQYIVNVNGVEVSFELPNIQPTPVP